MNCAVNRFNMSNDWITLIYFSLSILKNYSTAVDSEITNKTPLRKKYEVNIWRKSIAFRSAYNANFHVYRNDFSMYFRKRNLVAVTLCRCCPAVALDQNWCSTFAKYSAKSVYQWTLKLSILIHRVKETTIWNTLSHQFDEMALQSKVPFR